MKRLNLLSFLFLAMLLGFTSQLNAQDLGLYPVFGDWSGYTVIDPAQWVNSGDSMVTTVAGLTPRLTAWAGQLFAVGVVLFSGSLYVLALSGIRWLAARVEKVLWRFPALSLGCRAVEVLPALEEQGARLLRSKSLGVPLWPFFVFVVEKPRSP